MVDVLDVDADQVLMCEKAGVNTNVDVDVGVDVHVGSDSYSDEVKINIRFKIGM